MSTLQVTKSSLGSAPIIPPTPQSPFSQLKKPTVPRLLLATLIVVGVISLAIIYLFFRKPNQTPLESIGTIRSQISPSPSPSPTPFAFQEITIPALQSRSYQSSLGSLDQVIETSTYTTYLTNYDSDGLKINGLLYIPKGDPPTNEGPCLAEASCEGGWPAVVFVHGYIPPQAYRTLENYDSYASFLANNGLVVFKIDLRGHNQSEGDPGGAYYSSDYILDTLNAYSALQNFDQVNPNRIGLWGHSMGGNVVFRSLAVMQNIPKIVIWAGAGYTYEDLSQFGIDDNSYQPPPVQSPQRKKREELFNTYGQFNPTSWFWQQVPATNYLNNITGSVQIHHALNDPVVSIDYSRNLMSILDNTSIPHQLFEYSSGGHNLTGSVFNEAMNISAEFFKGD